jgi:TRAP transporter TAXI family solute receptor
MNPANVKKSWRSLSAAHREVRLPCSPLVRASLVLALTTLSVSALAQQFVRIGTGGTAGTYFPVGTLLAQAVSIPGQVVVSAQASNGSLGNVSGIASGAIETGFSQADVATWAQTGTGIFQGRPPVSELRLIATLYPEAIQIVARKSANIRSVADLKGKRVALDEPGSGTLVNARAVLAAWGMREGDIRAEYIKPNQAGDKMRDGQLDAFFFTGGAPAPAIADLAASGLIELVPLDGAPVRTLTSASPFLQADTLPAGTYAGVGATKTLMVSAQWVTSERLDAQLVYQLTRALYSANAQKLLKEGHAKGSLMTAQNAVKGAGIPFHPGALRYYREVGLLK